MDNLAVLVSGRGSNLRALHEATKDGRLEANIALVVSNNAKAPALKYCSEEGIPCIVLKTKDFIEKNAYFKTIGDEIERFNVNLIVLAGFMLLVPQSFIMRFKYRILNIHPSILPSFPGLEAQRQALEYGVKISGCTVFFVDEGCDTGPIIVQKFVQVNEDDTIDILSDRILTQEHDSLWQAVKIILDGKYKIEGRRVKILEDK